MQRNIALINYCIYISLFFYLIIDSLTGISLSHGGISFSVPYKFLVMILMTLVILNYNYNYAIFSSLYFFVTVISVGVGIRQSYSLLFQIIQNDMKLFSNFIFYFYFVEVIRHKGITEKKILSVLIVNFLIFYINILFGVMGLGYTTYDYGVGRKGFFYSGNEIFLVLLVSLYYFLRKYKYNTLKRFLIFVFLLTLGLIIGTKTAVLAVLVIFPFDCYINLSNKQKIRFILFFLPAMVAVVFFSLKFITSLSAISNAIYNIQKNAKSTNIINALLSNRLTYVDANFKLFMSNFSYDKLLFGANRFYRQKTCEIDFLDVFLQSGLIITFIVGFFYLYVIKRSNNKTLFLLNVIILGISMTAGHVWLNLTGGLFFMIINVLPVHNNRLQNSGVKK